MKNENAIPEANSDAYDPVDLVGVGHSIAQRILRSWANAPMIPSRGEENDAPSKTVPNQSMSIREIFQRFASGQPLSGNTSMVYTGDDPSPDLKKFDIEEIHEMQRENAATIERMRQDLQGKSKANKEKAVKEELEREAAAKQADIDAAVKAAKDKESK